MFLYIFSAYFCARVGLWRCYNFRTHPAVRVKNKSRLRKEPWKIPRLWKRWKVDRREKIRYWKKTTIACREGLTRVQPHNCFFTRDCGTIGTLLTHKWRSLRHTRHAIADKKYIRDFFHWASNEPAHSRFLSAYHSPNIEGILPLFHSLLFLLYERSFTHAIYW